MIPYEELVHALQEWRARQGLGAAPAPRVGRASGQVAAAAPTPYAPPPPQPGRSSGAFAAAPAAAAAVLSSRPPVDDFENGEGTEIRDGGMEDEIDVDAEAVDVLDEQIDE